MINFKVNGECVSHEEDISISEYLSFLKIDKDSVVVLLNDKILTKDEYSLKIYENCVLEILRFVSGG